MMDHIFLEIFSKHGDTISGPLESVILVFVAQYCEFQELCVHLIQRSEKFESPGFSILLDKCRFSKIEFESSLKENISLCQLPVAFMDDNTVISGLCSIARQLIKAKTKHQTDHFSKELLGFREACLAACNESSVWTKFCEIDLIETVKKLFQNRLSFDSNLKVEKDFLRFETHLKFPVRMHNVYKIARDKAKADLGKKVSIESSTPIENLDLSHTYAEGPYITLSDLILYPCFWFAKHVFGEKMFESILPLTWKWAKNLEKQNIPDHIFQPLLIQIANLKIDDYNVSIEKVPHESLYTSDPNRYKPQKRIFTKQNEIEESLKIIENMKIDIKPRKESFSEDISLEWDSIPLEANPEGGALPKKRSKRKCEQLENLAKPVLKMANTGDVIVDFCSGSGHLGILIAVLLPKCKIILLENKEKSLNRAKERVKKLELKNVTFLQCNLDYFTANFNIGVSLHACGVATDLVIQHCIRKRAKFVCCPCCYGSVHNCHHITYPRSEVFRQSPLTLKNYLVLGHAADQTHDVENAKTNQGIKCMDIIDADRCLQAIEANYKVVLYKMQPETCTPKNNLLIGWPVINSD